MDTNSIKDFAFEIRKETVREIGHKGGGHIGGSLSIVDVLAVLYGEMMNVRPEEPDWAGRDYFICSKGHAGPAVYATLAIRGFFSRDELDYLNKGGSNLPGHCDRNKVPGIDATTGSLGQGLSIACGVALGLKMQNRLTQKVYCVIGDGECDEGQIWEAAQFAAHYKLSNLCVFLDWNKKQIDGNIEDVMSHFDLEKKFSSFGWDASTINGNDVETVSSELKKWAENKGSCPKILVCDTTKGFGVPSIMSMEDNHCIGVSRSLYEKCMEELEELHDKQRV